MAIRKHQTTVKQRNLELAKEREVKRREFVKEHREMRKVAKEFGWPGRLSNQESFVNRKLEEWDRAQLKVPSGKYQDRSKIDSEYQRHFAKFIQECRPEVFEKLRPLTHYFDELFADDREKFLLVFDRYKTEFLFNLQSSLESSINYSLIEIWYLTFRSHGRDWRDYRYDYQIGENQGVFLFLRLLLTFGTRPEQRARNFGDAVKYVQDHLFFELPESRFPDNFDPSLVPGFISLEARKAVLQLVENSPENYFYDSAKRRLGEFLKEFCNGDEAKIEAFVELQVELFAWARKYHLEKDWLLRYAYFILSRFSETPAIQVSEIEIPQLQAFSLYGGQFELKFDGWFPGFEEKDEYEKRLRAAFEEEVTRYFHNAVVQLNLDQMKKETSPRNYDRVKWLVRWTVNEWELDEILKEIAGNDELAPEKELDETTLPKAFQQLQQFDLPCRQPSDASLAKMTKDISVTR